MSKTFRPGAAAFVVPLAVLVALPASGIAAVPRVTWSAWAAARRS